MNWHDPTDVARLEALRDKAWGPDGDHADDTVRAYRRALDDADPLARIRELEAENARLRGELDAAEQHVKILREQRTDLAALRERHQRALATIGAEREAS